VALERRRGMERVPSRTYGGAEDEPNGGGKKNLAAEEADRARATGTESAELDLNMPCRTSPLVGWKGRRRQTLA
jgi:hypothetical protein